MKIQLEKTEELPNSNPAELAKVILSRFGLLPRKKDGTAEMHKLLLELNERKKMAVREKKPETAVITVDEMALFAGIKRQTMYDYLRRWLDLNLLKKTSFVSDGRVIIGYELNGTSLEGSFRKAEEVIRSHLNYSFQLLETLQNEIKREKIKKSLAPREPVSEQGVDTD